MGARGRSRIPKRKERSGIKRRPPDRARPAFWPSGQIAKCLGSLPKGLAARRGVGLHLIGAAGRRGCVWAAAVRRAAAVNEIGEKITQRPGHQDGPQGPAWTCELSTSRPCR